MRLYEALSPHRQRRRQASLPMLQYALGIAVSLSAGGVCHRADRTCSWHSQARVCAWGAGHPPPA